MFVMRMMMGLVAVLGWTVGAAAADDDAVVGIVAPVRAVIPSDKPQIEKRVRIRVINGNREGSHTIEITASTSDCPAATITADPDFHTGVDGIQNTATLGAGKQRQAVLTITVSTAFATHNRQSPNRCSIQLSATSLTPSNVDPTPANNVTVLELNAFDLSDPEQSGVHETIVESFRTKHPGKVDIFAGNDSKSDLLKVSVINGDVDETGGDPITLTAADGDCPAGTVGTPDFDLKTPGAQNTVVVSGGRSARGTLPVTVHAADFLSPHRQSMGRCTAVLTAAGPGGDSDPSNNTTRVPINVLDRNDL